MLHCNLIKRMLRLKKLVGMTLLFVIALSSSSAQISINTDGSMSDSSAVLDITSTDRGMLIPRMDSLAREAIENPATGLMVFDNSTNNFWFYSGGWQEINTEGDNLGDHRATQNIRLDDRYLSGDGDDEGIFVDVGGNIGFGIAPSAQFDFLVYRDTTFIADAEATDRNSQVGAVNTRWQSYTALASGTVVKVKLIFSGDATGTREAIIYEGEGTAGTMLASDEKDVTGGGEISFNLVYDQIANQKYTIHLPNAFRWRFHNTDSDEYPGGISNLSAASDLTFKIFLLGSVTDNFLTIDNSGIDVGGYTIPREDGSTDQVLVSDGNGSLNWQDVAENTDDQVIDQLNLNETTLEISLEDDGPIDQTLDLAAINTDQQKIDVLNLNGSTLEISVQGDGENTRTLDLSSLAPVGTIRMWPNATPPPGWLICNGTSFSSSTYPNLVTVLGGNTLPNFNGRFPLGAGNSGTSGATTHGLSSTGGEEKHALTINEMPSHNHAVGSLKTNEAYLSEEGSGNHDQRDGGDDKLYAYSSLTGSTASVGGDQSHNNMPPFYTINFIIKAQ